MKSSGLCLSSFALCVTLALDVCAVTSPKTPVPFSAQFSAHFHSLLSLASIRLETLAVSKNETLDVADIEHCELVLDASADYMVSRGIQTLCEEARTTVLALSPSRKNACGNLHLSSNQLLQYFEATREHFNWTDFTLVFSPNEFGMLMKCVAEALNSRTHILVSDSDTAESIEKRVSTHVKLKGASVVVIATSSQATSALLPHLLNDGLISAGQAVLAVGEAVWGLQGLQGLLGIVDKDCMFATGWELCDAQRVAAELLSAAARQNSTVEGLSRSDLFPGDTQERSLPEAVLLNNRDGVVQPVGLFTAFKLREVAAIQFPGNATSLSRRTVEISFNSGLANPSSAPTLFAAAFYRGQTLATKRINERADILPSRSLVTNEVEFGAAQWDEAWATPRILRERGRLGVAQVAGYASVVTYNLIRTYTKLGIQIPVIGANGMTELGNATAFPLFLRNSVSELYITAQYTHIVQVLRWKRCAVLHGADAYGTSQYATFRDLAKARGIDILNAEELRGLPELATKEVYWNRYRQNLLELFRCNARYVVLILPDPTPQYILELMFDLGARKGDFIFTGHWVTTSYVTTGPAVNTMKHRELLEGTIAFAPAVWLGPVGEAIRRDFEAEFNISDSSPYPCLYYDSTLAIAHAIDDCIALGLNYEVPQRLMKCMRETRFLGCSGLVAWKSGENDRIDMDYNILNLVWNSTSQSYSLSTVGRYSPTSTQVFRFYAPFVFPDGSGVPPTDLRVVFTNCPFEDKLLHAFPPGRNVAISVCIFLILLSALTIAAAYKRILRVMLPEMVKCEISISDVVLMVTIAIEAVQLASLGPDFRGLNNSLMKLSSLANVDISALLSLRKGTFWLTLDAVFGAVGLWVCFNVFSLLRVEERFSRWSAVRRIGAVSSVLLPQLGNLCFVPIVSLLSDVFICDEAAGRGSLHFSDSILWRDCYVRCWSGAHSAYSAVAVVSLSVYVPTAIWQRPHWQDTQTRLHIATSPLFTMVKSATQVVLIALSKTAKRWGRTYHGVLFLCITATQFLIICVTRAYNYPRVNLWQGLSLLAVIAISATAILDQTLLSTVSFPLIAVVGVCWIALLSTSYSGFGLIYQRCRLPSLLYRRKGRDFGLLIRFAFTSSISAIDVQPKLNLASSEEILQSQNAEVSDVVININ